MLVYLKIINSKITENTIAYLECFHTWIIFIVGMFAHLSNFVKFA